MKLKRKSRFGSHVSTDSLNDIMFFLLLFFLIISTIANPNVIRIAVPKANAATPPDVPPVTLIVTEKKQIYIDEVPVAKENLEQQLTQRIQTLPDPTVVLRLDQSLTMQDIVDVLSVASRLKVKIVIATK